MVELLKAKSLDFSFGRTRVLSNVDFTLEQAKIWALIGPNGSGKSTFLRCLCGLLTPDQGQVLLQGKELAHLNRKWIARQICFLPQTQIVLQHLKVYELVALGRSPYQSLGWSLHRKDKDKIEWALDYMQLMDFQQRPLDSLSGGERQRAWIAMILAQDTPVVLMDEPATFLDMRYQWDLIERIQSIRESLHKSFIVAFHDLNHAAALADQVLVLGNGKVIQSGTPSNVITPELLQEVYGIRADVRRIPQHSHPIVIPYFAR